MADYDLGRTEQILKLLEQVTTTSVVGDFLKSKQLPFSGTWAALRQRISAAVSNSAVDNDELFDLLRSAEEYGKQHTFLYECSPDRAAELIQRDRIASVLQERGLSDLLVAPRILNEPESAAICDVRWETAQIDYALVIKEIEVRTSRKLRNQDQRDNVLTIVYDIVHERAVNVLRLHRNGTLEIRISSKTGSMKYLEDVQRFWRRMHPFVNIDDFAEASLAVAKERLLNESSNLTDRIRYKESKYVSDSGVAMTLQTSADTIDLYTNRGVQEGVAGFNVDGDAACRSHDIYFLPRENLSRETHVLLSGEVNEFAVIANCSERDYKYVFDQIGLLNTRVS